MHNDLDPQIQSRMFFRAAAIMVPIVLILVGVLTLAFGEDADVFMIGGMVILCGLGWLIYGLSRFGKSAPQEEDWPIGKF